ACTLLSVTREYVAVAEALPSLAGEVVQRLADVLKLFNSRTCQLVLGAGAMQVSGLKTITAKHLALSSQCISLVYALIPDLRRILSAFIPDARRGLVITHLDRVAQDYRVHRDEIHSKLVAIMRERLLVHLRSLPAVADTYCRLDDSPAEQQPSNFARALTKEVGVLHRILSPLLLEADLRSIFSCVPYCTVLYCAVLYHSIGGPSFPALLLVPCSHRQTSFPGTLLSSPPSHIPRSSFENKLFQRAKMIAFPAMPPPHMIMSAGNPVSVRAVDLIPRDGLPHETYRMALGTLMSSLARFNYAIIQMPPGDEALVRYTLDSSRVYFQFKRRPSPAMQSIPSADDPQEWNRTAGYYCEPHVGKEVYEFRPGATPISAVPEDSIPPSCLPDAFGSMGKTSRTVLEAIGRSLDLRSYTFTDLLDNVPLKANEISSSVLSVTCHGRRFANETMMDPAMDDKDPLLIPPEDAEARAEKGLVTLIKSDRPGLYIRDPQNQWLLADANLGPNDLILITGLTLYQATGGYVSPALYKTDLASASVGMQVPEGRASVFFRLLPRASSIIHCSAMAASGHAIAGPFQQPVAVQDFMLRQHPIDQIAAASYNGLLRPMGMGAAMPMVEPGSPNVRRRKKHRIMGSDGRSLAPSKRLRMEAQRVLKEKVQDLADAKGIKIRFCNLK
ncbi:unnamed protein product, partial [Closterium sp. NIES-54]